jgi:hypothetical protein
MSRAALTERIIDTAAQLPVGAKLGLVVMALGIGADLIAHLSPGLEHGHGGMTGPELSAHLVVFVGMALVLIGVVIDGVRSGRHRHEAAVERKRI